MQQTCNSNALAQKGKGGGRKKPVQRLKGTTLLNNGGDCLISAGMHIYNVSALDIASGATAD